MSGSEWIYWLLVKLSIVAIFSLMALVIGTYRAVKAIKHCVQSVKFYKLNKNKIFRDTRDQKRILYNSETHIVKDIILIILCVAEIGESVVITVTGLLALSSRAWEGTFDFYPGTNLTMNNCSYSDTWDGLSHVARRTKFIRIWMVFDYSFCSIGYIAFLLLLSFLTEYLSRRYFQHSYSKSVIRHLIILVIQVCIILIFTNLEIIALQLLIVPIFILINWCVLVKNSLHLRRVLKSNVRDLDLHFTHRHFYRQQKYVLQIYNISMPIFLAGLLFGALFFLYHDYLTFVIIVIRTPCVEAQIRSDAWVDTSINKIVKNLNQITLIGSLILLEIHFILQGLPLYIICFGTLYSACMKRLRMRKQKTRFSYEDFPHLL